MKQFKHDLDGVIGRALNAGLVGMVTCSIGVGSFRRTLGIIKKYRDHVFHSAGTHVSQLTRNEAESIIALTRKYRKDIVAIGEVGLDYYWVKDSAARRAQEPLFHLFIDLANELDLPIVIHSRKAEREAANMLERSFDGPVLMHCFDGPPEIAARVRDNGWFITLPANFERFRNRKRAATILPLDQIMLETDGPYLSPVEGRNEPANILYGCRSLAALLDQPEEDVAEVTTANAQRFYGVTL